MSGRRRVVVLVLLGVVVLAAGVWGVRTWRHWDRHVSTDDAFVEAHVSPVSARVRGTVLEVLVRDNQEVAAGAPLVRLDPRDLEVKVHQGRAALATAQSRLRMAAAGVPMTDESTRSQVALNEATTAKALLGIDGATGPSTSGAAACRRGAPPCRPPRPTSPLARPTSSGPASTAGAPRSCWSAR